jgi:REP element-mobilizing transposase RayT
MNRKSLVQRPVFFNKEGRLAVKEAIKAESQKWGQEILAIAVCKTHVHVVGNYVAVPVDVLVKYYKNAGRMALRRFGVDGRVWSRGYDRRFCFTEGELVGRIRYVAGHEKN